MLAVLQFDSTSVPVAERMLDEGRLPALAAARERGRSYELDPGTTPLFPSAAYPTLYSGVEIAEHGIVRRSLSVLARRGTESARLKTPS